MGYAISLWTPPALPIAGSSESFPVRRIFCVGRNYAEHQKEMGGDGREQPFFFLKSAHSLVAGGPRAALGIRQGLRRSGTLRRASDGEANRASCQRRALAQRERQTAPARRSRGNDLRS